MPNWCINNLTINGRKKDLVEFDRKFKSVTVIPWGDIDNRGQYSYSAFVKPTEEQLMHDYSSYGYHWCCDNWGCKWDVCDLYYSDNGIEQYQDDEECSISYGFDSPWGPPSKWIRKVIEMHPHLSFSLEFEEPGGLVHGKCVGHNGICEENIDIEAEAIVYFTEQGFYDKEDFE